MSLQTVAAPTRSKILVVDDDPVVRMSLAALLEDDFVVHEASDVIAADAKLAAEHFDVVLSDFEMPGETGMRFLRRVSAARPGTMCILVTGQVEHPEVRQAGKDEAIVRVISKPYDPARLLRWVENAARLAKMRQAMAALAARSSSRAAAR